MVINVCRELHCPQLPISSSPTSFLRSYSSSSTPPTTSLVLSASQGGAIVHLSGWFGCRCHSCRKTRQDFRRNRSTPPDDISRDICKSLAITCVAHSHIPCTWFELQRVKCCFRLGWISKGASRAALFSRPIVFFVKSCCLLFGLHTGTFMKC